MLGDKELDDCWPRRPIFVGAMSRTLAALEVARKQLVAKDPAHRQAKAGQSMGGFLSHSGVLRCGCACSSGSGGAKLKAVGMRTTDDGNMAAAGGCR